MDSIYFTIFLFITIAKDSDFTRNKIYYYGSSYSLYSTVTDFAKFRGWSTLQSRITAI